MIDLENNSLNPSQNSNTKVTVASITVSYNDKAALQKNIEGLLEQSHKIREIFVVDNASQDGSCEMIRDVFGAKVSLIPLSSNVGIGGGLKVGLQRAYQAGHDWIWFFDQDSLPMPTALEELLKFKKYGHPNNSVGILASLTICQRTGVSIDGELWKTQPIKIPPSWRRREFYCVDTVISSGSLLHRPVIKMVGYPNENLFIDFVDYEYCLRIRQAGFQVIVIRKSVIKHVIGNPKTVSRLGFNRVRLRHPAWREYYRLRNEVYVIWHQRGLMSKIIALEITFKRVVGVLIYEDQRILKLKFILLGFFHGIKGILGKRVLPQI